MAETTYIKSINGYPLYLGAEKGEARLAGAVATAVHIAPADVWKNVGTIYQGDTTDSSSGVNNRRSDWFLCAEGDSIEYILPMAGSNTATLQTVDESGSIVTEIAGGGSNDFNTHTHTFTADEYRFRLGTSWSSNLGLLAVKYTSANMGNLDDSINERFTDIDQSVYALDERHETSVEIAATYKNVGIGTPDYVTASRATSDFIDVTGFERIEVTADEGYDINIFGYFEPVNDSTDAWTRVQSNWVSSWEFEPVYRWFRVCYRHSDNSQIDTSDPSETAHVHIVGYVSDRSMRELSARNEREISRESLKAREGYIADYQFNTGSTVYTSHVFRCVPGDKLIYRLPQSTGGKSLIVYGKDGRITQSFAGLGTVSTTVREYTFTEDDASFVFECWRAVYTTCDVRYVSQYRGREDMPEDFETELSSVIESIRTETTGGGCVVFGFNTDQHSSYETFDRSHPMLWGLDAMKRVAETVPVNFICMGGDIVSYSHSAVRDILNDVEMMMKRLAGCNCPVISMAGNHEAFQNNSAMTGEAMFDENIKGAVLAGIVVNQNTSTTNCYRDDPTAGIRFIFIDSNVYYDNTSAAMGEYLRSCIQGMPEGYKAVVLSHQPLANLGDYFDNPIGLEEYYTDLADKILFFVNGHVHIDASARDTANILHVAVTTSGIDGNAREQQEVGVRETDTVNETAFDFFVLSKDRTTLKTIRYGFGSDRTFTL